MTFEVMNKVMNNLKNLCNSTVIQSVNENVIPKTFLKNLETPEKSTSLAFFFVKKFNEGFNEGSTKVDCCFNIKMKELNYIKLNEASKFSNPKYRQR